MPTFHDLHIAALLSNTRNKGDFTETLERETEYTWDGTLEGKITLMRYFANMKENESHSESSDTHIFDLESALLPILAHMEDRGVRVDIGALEDLRGRIQMDIDRTEKEIYEVVGEVFNINSPKQIQVILFEKLKIVPKKKNKTGFSVDTEVLEEIAKDYDIARLILEYRGLSKLQSTYVEALLRIADKKTHRIHTTYNQIGAATGRMSSTDPNLQNIPTGDGYAHEIKASFLPSSEHILIVADYSQIEIRVLAWLSGEPNLLEAFEKWEDIHARTAKFLFPDNVVISGEERRIAKTVNFGVIYGITGFGLSKTLECSPWEADIYIKAFYEKYPGVRSYYDSVLEHARELWYVETAFGRRRYIPGLTDANKTIRWISEREAINMPIQGTAADMIKYAMLDIDRAIREQWLSMKMILQVHDELVFDVPENERERAEILIREAMEGVLMSAANSITKSSKKIIPKILVDIGSGANWADAKG